MINTVVCNGKIRPLQEIGLHEFWSGFSFGAGLFETMLVKDGKTVALEYHLQRLNESLYFYRDKIQAPESDLLNLHTIRHWIHEAFEFDDALGKQFCGIAKIMVSDRNVLITFRRLPDDYQSKLDNGVSIDSIDEATYRSGEPTLNHKLTSYFRQYRYISDSVLFANEMGYICEMPTANIFFYIDDVWCTPKLSAPCLPGVARRIVLEDIFALSAIERDINKQELDRVSMCFLTNSVAQLVPVNAILSHELASSVNYCDEIRKRVLERYAL